METLNRDIFTMDCTDQNRQQFRFKRKGSFQLTMDIVHKIGVNQRFI